MAEIGEFHKSLAVLCPVGIGTTSPTNMLTVVSPSGGDGVAVVDNTGNTKGLMSIAGGDWGFVEVTDGNGGRTRISPIGSFFDGNVGIGTHSPDYTLHVAGKCISGENCSASGGYATVSGGRHNEANGGYATVSGGFQNEATGTYATVGGGFLNEASRGLATVAGGDANRARGYASFAVGRYCDADGYTSFAAGDAAKARHDGSFVWADYTYGDSHFTSTDENQFLIRARGGVGIGTENPRGYQLCVDGSAAKSSGGSSWATFSDARLKDVRADYEPGLSEVCQLTPVRYSYKQDNDQDLPAQGESVGVVAQQVREVLPEAVEENADGYLMVNNDHIIWAMVNAIKELDAQNQELKAQNMELIQRLDVLERTMGQHKLAVAK